ncbi:hypothetical protein, conserved [Trypanosoma brucei gambiense DAL972]|uniref:Vesicle transport protein n=1 Tax=Trypanosoma brucei gambiense (strain MHOM/CI/86/DAL972) TaxID=679716 RepID=C9ZKI8_TRYB9|nr:hypothetical protein, conserved [Trypanosoma brucei gambiense DAL972]CBH09954.1 hypothetical protein, conserved [Trypanosoma brucei gambiense DAL972]|eukprot:XP_011772245.1 hypothetical protein, conserved [Trypanosoma brucei gambiense DAL972]
MEFALSTIVCLFLRLFPLYSYCYCCCTYPFSDGLFTYNLSFVVVLLFSLLLFFFILIFLFIVIVMMVSLVGLGAMMLSNAQESFGSAFSSAGNFFGGVKRQAFGMFSDEPPAEVEVLDIPEDTGLIGDVREMMDLSYSQRLWAFFMVLGMGIVFIVIAALFAPTVALFPKKFAFFLTVGNMFCFGSTMFLVGIKQQLHSLFSAKRLEAGIAFIVSLLLTLFFTLYWKSSFLAVFFAVVQVLSMMWYALSFVPFLRTAVATVSSYMCRATGSIIGFFRG